MFDKINFPHMQHPVLYTQLASYNNYIYMNITIAVCNVVVSLANKPKMSKGMYWGLKRSLYHRQFWAVFRTIFSLLSFSIKSISYNCIGKICKGKALPLLLTPMEQAMFSISFWFTQFTTLSSLATKHNFEYIAFIIL